MSGSFVKHIKSKTKAQYDSASTIDQDSIYWLEGQTSPSASGFDTKNARIMFNGKDYSGAKKIETGNIAGAIAVDGVSVPIYRCATLNSDGNLEQSDPDFTFFMNNYLPLLVDEISDKFEQYDAMLEAGNEHINDTSNPHSVTKSQIGLGNVTNDAQIKASEKGVSNGVASLDSTGHIPSSQIISDVIEIEHVIEYDDNGTYYFKYGTPAYEVKKGSNADPSYVKTPVVGKMYFVESPYVSGNDNKLLHGIYNGGNVQFAVANSDPDNNRSVAEYNKLYVDTESKKLYICTNKTYATLQEIPYHYETDLKWGGRSISNGFSPIDAALYQNLGNNVSAFMPANAITIEYSRDGGSTWNNYGATDVEKTHLFSDLGTSLFIGKNESTGINYNNYQLRITLDTQVTVSDVTSRIYALINKFILNISTNGAQNCWCTIDARKQYDVTHGNNIWTTFADKTNINGWSGYNVINTSDINTYSGNSTQATSQYGQLRFTFGCESGNTNYKGLNILSISCFGKTVWQTPSAIAKTGHIYTYDGSQSVEFPNMVKASGFRKKGSDDTYVLLGNGGHKLLSTIDTQVTQTVTSNTNQSYRPLLLGDSFSDSSTFSPTTTTASAYSTHLAKFQPSAGLLFIGGLGKMNTDGTVAAGSNSNVWNTNGGITSIATTSAAGLMSAIDKSNLEVLKSDQTRYIVQNTTTPLKCHERWQTGTAQASLPIYECISGLNANNQLVNVTGKAKYIMSCVAMTESTCVPCKCTRDATTKKWVPTRLDGSSFASDTIFYVKFIYNKQAIGHASQGSPSLTNGS